MFYCISLCVSMYVYMCFLCFFISFSLFCLFTCFVLFCFFLKFPVCFQMRERKGVVWIGGWRGNCDHNISNEKVKLYIKKQQCVDIWCSLMVCLCLLNWPPTHYTAMLTLNFESSYLQLLRAQITGLHHHARLVWC